MMSSSDSKQSPPRGLYVIYKDELEAWNAVNRQLKQHGLKQVLLSNPQQLLHNDDIVGFCQADSESLRDNLVVLMKDGDRRQTLIQDLIITNNQLRTDLETRGPVSSEADIQAIELQNQLSSANSRIAELEVMLEQRHEKEAEESERVTNTKLATQARNKQLEKRCALQEEELERLRSKVQRLNADQERREKRVKEIFYEMRRGASNRGLSAVDKRLLDVIDMYESEICKLKRKLDKAQTPNNNNGEESDREEDLSMETNRYKEFIKSFSSDLKHNEKEMKKLRDRNELLEIELQSRPLVEDYNKCKQKVRQLERLLQEHNIGVYGRDAFNKKSYSTRRDDIDFLPLNHCRKFLMILCEELDLSDLEDLQSTLQSQKTAVESFPKVESLITQIADVLESSLTKQKKGNHRIWCSKHWKSALHKLESWKLQMQQMPELNQAVGKLLLQFEKPRDSISGKASISEIIKAIESISAETIPTPSQPVANETTSHAVLLSIVKHFQYLFDVPTVSGIFPRMNELFTRFNEMKNVHRTLADLLDLSGNYKGSDIVDAVGRVCQSYTSSTFVQLKQLLQEDELDSVIERLDEHRRFVPLFRDIMDHLMEILEVERMDQVVPSVRALKLMIS